MRGILQTRYFGVAWWLRAVANFREPPHAKSGMMGDVLMYATNPCCLTLEAPRLESTLYLRQGTPNWSVPTVRSAPCPPITP